MSQIQLALINIIIGRLLQFVKLLESNFYTCHNYVGLKYLTRLTLDFSKLRYHKFKHGFIDANDLFGSCSTAIDNNQILQIGSRDTGR